MSKCERKKKTKSPKGVIAALGLLILVAVLVLYVMPQVLYITGDDSDAENTESQNQSSQNQEPVTETNAVLAQDDAVTFPIALDDGKLEIECLFQFSGVNPDAQKQNASDVASIVLRNTSDKYLRRAAVNATLGDGSERTFIVNDIPAGASVMAFSMDNESLLPTDVCVDVVTEAIFEDIPNSDSVEVSVDGLTVTLKNISSEDLNEIDVYYRDVFNDKYFGGMTYTYTIEKLSADETVTITAEESLLGVIEVVRIAVNH